MQLTATFDATGSPQVLFPIHFEFDDHLIEHSTLHRCLKGIEEIYKGVDTVLIGSPVDSEVFLLPLQPGGVTAFVGKATKGIAIFALGALASPMIEGFVKEATGTTLEDFGASIYNIAANFPDDMHELVAKSKDDFDGAFEAYLKFQSVRAELCRSLLEADADRFEELASEIPDAALFLENGRRIFFEACRANERLPSIQFGTMPTSRRIFRSEFKDRTKRTHVESLEIDKLTKNGKWQSEILELTITSPNWERTDQQRGWKGKLSDGKYIYFDIIDTKFWRLVHEQKIDSGIRDKMTAQFIFQRVNGRYKDAEAIKVLNFNAQKISDPLASDIIEQMLSDRNSVLNQSQTPLFPAP